MSLAAAALRASALAFPSLSLPLVWLLPAGYVPGGYTPQVFLMCALLLFFPFLLFPFFFFFLLCLCFFLCSFRPFPAHWVARRLLGRYSLALRPPRYGAVGGGTPYCAARSRPSRRAGLRSCGRVQCLPAIALPLPVLRSGSYRLLCPSVQFSGRARFLIPGTASREAGRQATGRREEGGVSANR